MVPFSSRFWTLAFRYWCRNSKKSGKTQSESCSCGRWSCTISERKSSHRCIPQYRSTNYDDAHWTKIDNL
jgi:hypothetical protein